MSKELTETISIRLDKTELNDALETVGAELKELLKELKAVTGTLLQPALLSAEDASAYVGIAEATLAKYRMDGLIGERTPAPAHVKIGKKVMYERAELDRWIREDLPRFGGRKSPEGLR